MTSKALSREYVNPDAQCHVALAERLTEEYGLTFLSNERIPYMIIYDKVKTNSVNKNLSDVVQHPDYLKEG